MTIESLAGEVICSCVRLHAGSSNVEFFNSSKCFSLADWKLFQGSCIQGACPLGYSRHPLFIPDRILSKTTCIFNSSSDPSFESVYGSSMVPIEISELTCAGKKSPSLNLVLTFRAAIFELTLFIHGSCSLC